ncbi:MAG: hypothetical protein HC860_15170 [Alkalinema sp. RU_4_3]|nr:hypothetical protein [Alkalinema sp. RU_4_3]
MLKLLEQHLAHHQWQSADQETSRIVNDLLRNAVNAAQHSTESQPLSNSLFDEQSQQTLFQIDSLWREYSSDRFGFRRQAEIWFDSGLDPHQVFQWNQFTFNPDACPGHLPTISHLDYVECWSEYGIVKYFVSEVDL